MVIHTDKYEKIVFMENQLKSQKKIEWSMVFSIYKAVYVHQTPVGIDKS